RRAGQGNGAEELKLLVGSGIEVTRNVPLENYQRVSIRYGKGIPEGCHRLPLEKHEFWSRGAKGAGSSAHCRRASSRTTRLMTIVPGSPASTHSAQRQRRTGRRELRTVW